MLHDPQHDVTLSNLIGFLGTKKPTEKYDYFNVDGDCMLGQFFNFIGLRWKGCSGPGWDYWRRLVAADTGDHSKWTDPFLRISYEGEFTFGAAFQRAVRIQRELRNEF